MVKTSADDLAQVQLMLEQTHRVRFYRHLFVIFWALILAKCLFLEWLTQRYAMPINTLLYIWIPSFLFAGLCTALLAATRKKELLHAPLTGKIIQATWLGIIAALAVIGITGVGLHKIPVALLPGLCALLMGIGYLIHSVLHHHALFRIAALGWWMGAFWLFYNPGPFALLGLAFMLILFQVIPTGLVMYEDKRQQRRSALT